MESDAVAELYEKEAKESDGQAIPTTEPETKTEETKRGSAGGDVRSGAPHRSHRIMPDRRRGTAALAAQEQSMASFAESWLSPVPSGAVLLL